MVAVAAVAAFTRQVTQTAPLKSARLRHLQVL
jgi:hypothetical protein